MLNFTPWETFQWDCLLLWLYTLALAVVSVLMLALVRRYAGGRWPTFGFVPFILTSTVLAGRFVLPQIPDAFATWMKAQ